VRGLRLFVLEKGKPVERPGRKTVGRVGVTRNGSLVAEGMIECRLRRFCVHPAAIVRLGCKAARECGGATGAGREIGQFRCETLVRGGKLFLISGLRKLQRRRVLV